MFRSVQIRWSVSGGKERMQPWEAARDLGLVGNAAESTVPAFGRLPAVAIGRQRLGVHGFPEVVRIVGATLIRPRSGIQDQLAIQCVPVESTRRDGLDTGMIGEIVRIGHHPFEHLTAQADHARLEVTQAVIGDVLPDHKGGSADRPLMSASKRDGEPAVELHDARRGQIRQTLGQRRANHLPGRHLSAGRRVDSGAFHQQPELVDVHAAIMSSHRTVAGRSDERNQRQMRMSYLATACTTPPAAPSIELLERLSYPFVESLVQFIEAEIRLLGLVQSRSPDEFPRHGAGFARECPQIVVEDPSAGDL